MSGAADGPRAPGAESAVMLMPRGPGAWAGSEALWITAREWARAAERRFGAAWIATPDGAWAPGHLPRPPARAARRATLGVPLPLRTLAKDVRLAGRQARFAVGPRGPWEATTVRLVWEHHDLFNRAGGVLAAAHGAPLVRFVHAPQVWEAAEWGVRRPLWGRLLARGESRHLGAADLVACVSSAVAERLLALGVAPDRLLVSPMGVDPHAFSPAVDGAPVRRRLGIPDDAVVVGWCGSFRPFHGLDTLLDAFGRLEREAAEVPLRLLLVGDGPLRESIARAGAARGLGGRLVLSGEVPHREMPAHVRAMDVAVVSSSGPGGFHYSPLKAREYAACGRPLVAPDQGELAELRAAGFLALFRPGDAVDLADALSTLVRDERRRRERGERARAFAVDHWSWDARLADALAAAERLRSAAGEGGLR